MHNKANKDRFAGSRRDMLERNLKGRGITDSEVLKVMGQVQRQEFVPEKYYSQAYADGPLPLGMDQTISQPYIVALMTQELQLNHDCEVLEIGTGSGYQTAILAELAKRVYTIEKLNQLSESAQVVLGRLGIKNVEFYIGDGSCGWPSRGMEPGAVVPSFDRIIFTAAAPKMPEPLGKQLADGGLMVGPIGYGVIQELMAFEKKAGKITEKAICDVRFVRLIGKYGFEE